MLYNKQLMKIHSQKPKQTKKQMTILDRLLGEVISKTSKRKINDNLIRNKMQIFLLICT